MTETKIWDPVVRVFHWSLVIGFTANALILDDEDKVPVLRARGSAQDPPPPPLTLSPELHPQVLG